MNTKTHLTRSALIERLAEKQETSSEKSEQTVKIIYRSMVKALAAQRHIEIRGFGSFDIHVKKAISVRNPQTGEKLWQPIQYVPHFKAGGPLKKRVTEIKEVNDPTVTANFMLEIS